jgi:prepilin peptidase CpaA
MNLPLLLLTPLGAALLCASVYDLRWRRIPNAISGLVFVSGLGVTTYLHGMLALGSGLAASLVLLALLFPAWRSGGIGGGDVKLAAAVGAWVGLAHFIWFVLASALAGGVVAGVVYMFASPGARAEVKASLVLAGAHGQMPDVPSHRKGHLSVPYAVAISAGAAVALLVA